MIKKYLFFISVALGFSFTAFGQNEKFHLSNPELLTCKLIRISPPLNMIPQDNLPKGRKRPLNGDGEEEEGQIKLHKPVNAANALPKGIDPALQKVYNYRDPNSRTPTGLNLQFAGQGFTNLNPSDNNMASGPNHIVQMINHGSGSSIRIWNKTGTVLVNQVILSSITGHGGFGDPVVLYDQLADRYLLAEFGSSGNHIYIAVSQTADPTGTYFVYDFATTNFPDYFKIAAWGNSYIVTSNENSPALYAMDRTKMLAGTPTSTVQRFTVPSYPTISFQALTPVDLSGSAAQPAGSPALLMRMADDAWTTGIVDRLEIFSFNVDWVTPANTTLTGPDLLPTLPFSTNFCGYTTFSCIPQQGSSTKLDPLREVLMNKSYYRNFGTYESIVCNHVTDIDGTSHAGVRWYELRKTAPSTSWVIYQQGTYAPPGTLHRWMACIAINGNGDIGLGYNIAGTTFPTMAYTGRRSCDPLGTMTEPETIVIAGTSPNGSNRWGDYNGMTVDPVDGSFWFTTNYNATTQWATRVANFSLPTCGCTPASISTQPANTATCAGNATGLTVVAAGTGPLSYQWQESSTGCGGPWNNIANAGVYSGATTATLTITGATAGMNNYGYRCIVTGNCAPLTATSNCASLTVNAATAVTGQPANSTICANANTSFTAAATGSSLGYQWQVSTNGGGSWASLTNVAPYSGVTTTTLNITAAPATLNGYQYRCVVSSSCSPLNSNAATLTVNNAPAITSQPSSITVCAGNSANFSVTATGGGLSYQWQESTNGGGTWGSLSNVAPYSGVTSATLTVSPAALAMTSYQYRCIVTGSCPSPATSNAAMLTVGTALNITSQPVSQTICEGANTSFTVATSGTVISYQWQESTNGGGTWNTINNTGVYSGTTTATLTLTGVPATMNTYQYRCVITGACPPINSNAAILTVNTLPNISAQPVNSTVYTGQPAVFSVTATGTGISYQWQVSTGGCPGPWVNITNVAPYSGVTTATLTINPTTVVMNGYGYRCVVSGTCSPAATSGCGSLTVNIPVSVTAPPANTTVCAGATATFSVTAAGTAPTYQWQESINGGGTWNNITNSGIYSGAATTTLTLTGVTAGMNGYVYRVVVFGAPPGGSVNSATATLTVNTAPAITAQPAISSIICATQNTSFSVGATGTALTYQWQVSTDAGATYNNIANGGVYNGTTAATLVITGATVGMNTYKYRCLVSGNCAPAVTTGVADLTVYTPISITTPPANSTICATGTTSFTLVAAGTGPTYQWQESTNSGGTWNNITNGGIYSGAATATLTLTGLVPSMNNNQYRCVVAGTAPCGVINSLSAILTVSPQPTVTLTASPYTKLFPGYSTVITATVNPPAGFTTVWTRNGNPVTPINNTYNVNVDRLGTYTVVATIGTCISVPASITISDSASTKLWIFPSPTSGQFTISYYNPGGGATTQMVNIYDAMGRRVYSNVVAVSQAYQLIPVDMRRNGAGVYRVVMRDSAGKKVKTGTVVIR